MVTSTLEEALNQTRVEINDTRAKIIELTNELRGEPQPDEETVKFLRQSILSLRRACSFNNRAKEVSTHYNSQPFVLSSMWVSLPLP